MPNDQSSLPVVDNPAPRVLTIPYPSLMEELKKDYTKPVKAKGSITVQDAGDGLRIGGFLENGRPVVFSDKKVGILLQRKSATC